MGSMIGSRDMAVPFWWTAVKVGVETSVTHAMRRINAPNWTTSMQKTQ
jgi:hypothetical protein